MKLRSFLDVVPVSFKRTALILAVCFGLGGMVVAVVQAMHQALVPAAQGLAFGLLAPLFVSTWVLCLGYVYADARRRAMPPILWTLVAAFIPNLLGFLLYFACRRPVALPCAHCGQPIAADQRFCSWCGSQASLGIPVGK